MDICFINFCAGMIVFYFLKDVLCFHSLINPKNKKIILFSFLSVFGFIFLNFIYYIFDILTTNKDKPFLHFKTNIYLYLTLTLELLILIILPFFYCFYLFSSKRKEENRKIQLMGKGFKYFKVRDSFKILFGYLNYIMILFLFNYFYYYYIFLSSNNKTYKHFGFYSYIEENVYLNLFLFLFFGKFIGFTYIPYGLASITAKTIDLTDEQIFITNHYDNEENLYLVNSDQRHSNEGSNKQHIKHSFLKRLLFVLCCNFIVIMILSSFSLIVNFCSKTIFQTTSKFNLVYTLDDISLSLKNIYGSFAQFSFFLLVLFFKIFALIEGLNDKGVAVLYCPFFKFEENLPKSKRMIMLWIILYSTIIMFCDFNYLIPSISFYNNDSLNCLKNQDENSCGISVNGSIILKIQNKFYFYREFEIISSMIFVLSCTYWVFNLIIRNLLLKVVDSQKSLKIFRNNFKLSQI
jgi:hypothetical protein